MSKNGVTGWSASSAMTPEKNNKKPGKKPG